jgi:hypothetical protein
MAHRRNLFLGSVVALVALAVLIVGLLAPEETSSRNAKQTFGDASAPIFVRLTLDTLDATRGVLRVRVVVATENLPEDGATLFTNLPGLTKLSLPEDAVASDKASEVLVEAGDIADYPFDTYSHAFQLVAVPGRNARQPTTAPERSLPVEVEVVNALAGFSGNAIVDVRSGVTVIQVDLPRQPAAVVWATAMMAIFWLLAICGFAVMLATVLRLREFETRHLAWLVAMIFAFAAFRNTAPGSPPLGVFLDFASFFWDEAIVALSLVALVVFYLTGDRGAVAGADAATTGDRDRERSPTAADGADRADEADRDAPATP